MSDILTLEKIICSYPGGATVLDGLDFSLPEGRKCGLIGPNGSGKTTMFLAAMGLLPRNSGRVLHRGRPVETDADLFELRCCVGLVFQNADDQLFCPTVLEDVAFGPLNLGRKPREAEEIAADVLGRLGMAAYADRVTHKLSGGEKRIIALAAVLAMEPEALLLDEPTNDLDPDTRHRLIHVLNDLEPAMAIISHDWDFLDQTTGTVFAFKNGRVALDEDFAPHSHFHAHPQGTMPHRHNGHGHDHEPGNGHTHEHEHSEGEAPS